MKLGVLSVALGEKTLEEACRWLKARDVDMIEIGTGGYPGKSHCDPNILLEDEEQFRIFVDTLKEYDLQVSALSCHGNMVHPDEETAKRFRNDFIATLQLAEKMGVHIINTFSGCPGGSEKDATPNWVTCPWPDDFSDILRYQWEDVLIPFWAEYTKLAEQFGVDKIALEMHPGFCVYNTKTLLRLRKEVGSAIGANFDPSHLIWQGMDPAQCIRKLGKENAIFHFHAKDTRVNPYETAKNGVLDTEHYQKELERSWIFRTVGYGNGEEYWRNILSELRLAGYDHAVSIEHEDSLMSGEEGLDKAIRFLNRILIREKRGEMFWA